MRIITGDSVYRLYYEARILLEEIGVIQASRNGTVLVAPYPIMSIYTNPTNRVLLDRRRNANHAFHINEAIWMLAGSSDARWLDQFVHDFSSRYADPDTGRLDGAYGFRWSKHFYRGKQRLDQLEEVIDILTRDPTSRRAVIAMHDPASDLNVDTKDQPCNTHIYFRIFKDSLDMTVMCRSNDIIWGAYGANAVHFSVLQEYIAAALALKVGMMYQFSNNWHAYASVLNRNPLPKTAEGEILVDGYRPVPLVTNSKEFVSDCVGWISDEWETTEYSNSWFTSVLMPIRKSFIAAKNNDFIVAYQIANQINDDMWAIGMKQWITHKKVAYDAR